MSWMNTEQADYVSDLGKLKPEDKCYCGWYPLGECPNCPPDKTCADKLKARCKHCLNEPNPHTGKLVHNINCRTRRNADDKGHQGDSQ